MSLILQVLTGTFPPFLARRKTPRKRSPEYLEAARIYWRQRRAAQTKEDRDAEYLRKKEILPSGARNRDVLPGWTLEWSRVFDNEFAGASVSVVILSAQRRQPEKS